MCQVHSQYSACLLFIPLQLQQINITLINNSKFQAGEVCGGAGQRSEKNVYRQTQYDKKGLDHECDVNY